MMGWEDAVAHALTLPGTELSTYYGGPAVKVAANARAFLSQGHEANTSFCLALDLDTVDLLKETDPDTFFQTPHYIGWPAVLVRYDTRDPDRVKAMIVRAYEQAAARAKAKSRPKKA